MNLKRAFHGFSKVVYGFLVFVFIPCDLFYRWPSCRVTPLSDELRTDDLRPSEWFDSL